MAAVNFESGVWVQPRKVGLDGEAQKLKKSGFLGIYGLNAVYLPEKIVNSD